MFINAYDMARFGYLTLRHGKWKERQLISNRWIDNAAIDGFVKRLVAAVEKKG
jgi:CubicO group peptidase (beta-lactamase class C family)